MKEQIKEFGNYNGWQFVGYNLAAVLIVLFSIKY